MESIKAFRVVHMEVLPPKSAVGNMRGVQVGSDLEQGYCCLFYMAARDFKLFEND